MEQEKKKKLINVSLWALLGIVILFVIVTSCIVKSKEEKLDDLTQSNQQIEDKLNKNEDEIKI